MTWLDLILLLVFGPIILGFFFGMTAFIASIFMKDK